MVALHFHLMVWRAGLVARRFYCLEVLYVIKKKKKTFSSNGHTCRQSVMYYSLQIKTLHCFTVLLLLKSHWFVIILLWSSCCIQQSQISVIMLVFLSLLPPLYYYVLLVWNHHWLISFQYCHTCFDICTEDDEKKIILIAKQGIWPMFTGRKIKYELLLVVMEEFLEQELTGRVFS